MRACGWEGGLGGGAEVNERASGRAAPQLRRERGREARRRQRQGGGRRRRRICGREGPLRAGFLGAEVDAEPRDAAAAVEGEDGLLASEEARDAERLEHHLREVLLVLLRGVGGGWEGLGRVRGGVLRGDASGTERGRDRGEGRGPWA